MSPLRKREEHNVFVEIPDEDWKCPGCGVGHCEDKGLFHDEHVGPVPAEDGWNNGLDLVVCYNCDWHGTALQLYEHAAAAKRKV